MPSKRAGWIALWWTKASQRRLPKSKNLLRRGVGKGECRAFLRADTGGYASGRGPGYTRQPDGLVRGQYHHDRIVDESPACGRQKPNTSMARKARRPLRKERN